MRFDCSIRSHQVIRCKIPSNRSRTSHFFQVFVHRTRLGAVDIDLGHHLKIGAITQSEFVNLLVAIRFLTTELIAGKRHNIDFARVLDLRPELDQLLIVVVCVSTVGSHVHDNCHLSRKFGKRYQSAMYVIGAEIKERFNPLQLIGIGESLFFYLFTGRRAILHHVAGILFTFAHLSPMPAAWVGVWIGTFHNHNARKVLAGKNHQSKC
mmetsp:Transcript_95071/g.266190  ORF Transcript_95071/g.266190 Transcript_95071/m.266190 type:complete len:209 (+) Transcript_95071:49-675(+)